MALGKGLQSLIPKKNFPKKKNIIKTEQSAELIKEASKGRNKKVDSDLEIKKAIFNVEIDKIKPNPHQPREKIDPASLKELADSIREYGVLQPILVSKIEKETKQGRVDEYQLIAGERRWRAAKMAGLPSIPVIIRESSNLEKLELALVENIQRADLNPLEAARAFKELHDRFGLSQREIAQKVGRSREAVANSMRLLDLPSEMQDGLVQGKITEAHARAILAAAPNYRFKLYYDIIRNGLTVKEAEEKARNATDNIYVKIKRAIDPNVKGLEVKLKDALGYPVSISTTSRKKRISIEFADARSLKDFARELLELIASRQK